MFGGYAESSIMKSSVPMAGNPSCGPFALAMTLAVSFIGAEVL